MKDFEAIDLIAITGLAIVVNPSVPARTLKDLIDYARANSRKLSYGTAGVGSVNHLAGELFKSLIDTPAIVHVPYRGAGPALIDLISGQIPIVMANVTSQLIELNRSGKARILAVTTPTRLVGTPDIPTAVEQGLAGMISQNFIGLFAPAGTPKPICEQILQTTRQAIGDIEYQRMLLASGLDPVLDSRPDKARRFVEQELARWTPIIEAVGLKID